MILLTPTLFFGTEEAISLPLLKYSSRLLSARVMFLKKHRSWQVEGTNDKLEVRGRIAIAVSYVAS